MFFNCLISKKGYGCKCIWYTIFFYFSDGGSSGCGGSDGGNKGTSHYSSERMLCKLHIGVLLHRHSIYIQTKFLLF
jgi:hypothetical protein